MGRKKEMRYPEVPTYVPKSKGNCGVNRSGRNLGGCGEPVYKSPVRHKNAVWHSSCLVEAARQRKV